MRSTLITGAGPTRPASTIALADNTKSLTAFALHLTVPTAVIDPGGGAAPNPAVWTFEVYAQYQEGEFLLGIVTTTAVSAGARPARTIALGYCPGAKTWRVVAFGPIGAVASVSLSSDECCNGGFLGLVSVNDAQITQIQDPTPTFVASQGVLSSGPAILYSMSIFVDPAFGPVWVGPVDKATAVVNGDPWADLPVQFQPGGQAAQGNYVKTWRLGLRFVNQIRWACSATPAIVTLAPSASVGGETS
jgi:hypothetical protein